MRNNQDNNFKNHKVTNINGVTLNRQAENDNEVITKAYVDPYHQQNERSRRYLDIEVYDESSDLVKNNQVIDFNDNKIKNLDSVSVKRNPSSDNELINKKHIDDELGKNTIARFSQTLENYLKVSVGDDTYNLSIYDKIQITDTTAIKVSNVDGYLLPYWKIISNDKNKIGKISNFIKSTKTNSSTTYSGATNLPPIGNSFMCLETSSNNHGKIVFVSFERTDIIQTANIII